jgi:hypothetical protein
MASTAGSLARPSRRSAVTWLRAASTCRRVTLIVLVRASFLCLDIATDWLPSLTLVAFRIDQATGDYDFFHDVDGGNPMLLRLANLRHRVPELQLRHLIEEFDHARTALSHGGQTDQEAAAVLPVLRIVAATQLRGLLDPVPVVPLSAPLDFRFHLTQVRQLVESLASVPPAVAEPSSGECDQRDHDLCPEVHGRTVPAPRGLVGVLLEAGDDMLIA